MTTLLSADNRLDLDAGSAPWLDVGQMEMLTGWRLKPEGLCRDDVCVPVPAGRESEFVDGERVNAEAFWAHLGKPLAVSNDRDVWFFGEDAGTRNAQMTSLEAPDFTLPDFDGELHSLHDFRRQRVLLLTWASW